MFNVVTYHIPVGNIVPWACVISIPKKHGALGRNMPPKTTGQIRSHNQRLYVIVTYGRRGLQREENENWPVVAYCCSTAVK